ncbi:hypothetical protein [Xanthomarina gelatinilytica]|uniref:hypothetical protein n=1 Tax=Xanthomarina gelatinilytica TaxID=1137281 RepID=UPI003AA8655F
MQQEELWIEGIQFDLGDRTVSQTFQINDLGELKDRQGNYSNTIRAPRTPKNVAALNYLGIAGSQSRAPFRKLRAKYIVNGIELVSDGYVRIPETDTTIDIILYSGNVSLMDAIKGKKINELNFQDLNHYLNISSFENGMANTEGYIYAIGDFGIDAPPLLVRVERQAPSLYFQTLWKKIFEEAGKTYSGDFFENNESFKSEILPPTKGYEIIDVEVSSEDIGTLETDEAVFLETTNQNRYYNHEYSFTPSGALTDMTLVDPKHLRMDFEGVAQLTLSISYGIIYGRAIVTIVKNGSAVLNRPLPDGGSSETIDINLVVQSGDIVSIELNAETERTDPILPIYQIDLSAEILMDVERLEGGVFIDFNEISSKMFQSDFVKDIMQRYGLMFKTKGNHYEFIQIETLCNSRGNAEDWSDKVSVIGTESYDLGNYGINNLLKYQYTDGVLEYPQDGIIVADNEHLTAEKEMFTSAFTISQQSSTLITAPTYSVPLWEGKYDDEGTLEEVKIKEIAPRIFKVKRYNGSISVKFFETGPVAIEDNVAFLSLENVQMDFYVANNYPAFNRMLNAPRVRTNLLYLSPIDIYQLDFFRLKYLKQLGQYFYLNKVSNYIPGKLTKCEMVQVNGISAGTVDGNQPPTQLGLKERTTQFGSSFALSLSDFMDTIPTYFDPEYDAPQTIKIISFGTSKIKMRHNGVVIDSDTIVDANDFNLSIEDLGLTVQPHVAEFDFKIQSFNNPNFSEVTGTIRVNVLEKINNPPVADAGPDILVQQEPEPGGDDYDYEMYIDGSNSYDPDGDTLEFLWELIDAPIGVTLTDEENEYAFLAVHIENGPDVINFQIKLTVTDPLLLEDSDTINVTLTNLSNNG